MAKLLKGILGPISGKLGPIVGGSWKGIAYLREAPKADRKKASRTPAQLANEMKFKFVQRWLVPFYPYVTVGFSGLAKGKTELNAAFSAIYHQAVVGQYPNLTIDYSKVKISIGKLPPLNKPRIALASPDILEIAWQQNVRVDALFDDQLMLVLYNADLKKADGFIGGVKRAALRHSFKIDPEFVGKELEVYLSITSADRKKISNSLYMGRVVPL